MGLNKQELDYYFKLQNEGFGEILYHPNYMSYRRTLGYLFSDSSFREFLNKHNYILMDTDPEDSWLHFRTNHQYGLLEFYICIEEGTYILHINLGHSCSVGYRSAGSFTCKIDKFENNYNYYRDVDEKTFNNIMI